MSVEPEMIGRYRVERRLGAGGFATVYLAEDMRLDAQVAVKLLHPQMANDGEIRSRFIREAQIMRRLATPGLVAVHDIDEHEGQPFFVMEYCAGGTLAERLDAIGHPIGLAQALPLAAALREATAGIHRAGTVHRDLKPNNYLIRRRPDRGGIEVDGVLAGDEELVVGDFGLAKVVEVDATKLTVSGGTPGFGAPEQFQGDPTVDARADVYSLSAILLSALSGQQPQLVLAPGMAPFESSALAAAGPLAGELQRGMALDRAERHRDVVEWEAALASAGAGAVAPGGAVTQGGAITAGGAVTQIASEPLPSEPLPDGRVQQPPDGGGDGGGAGPGSAGAAARSTPRWLLPVLAVAAIVVLLGGGLFLSGLLGGDDGSVIAGPERGSTGDEVAFAVEGPDAAEARWTVNDGGVTEGAVVAFTPPVPGRYRVEVDVGGELAERSYVADEAVGDLRIEGPAVAPVGQTTVLRVVGAQPGDEVLWTIAGASSSGDTAELRPLAAGTISVSASVDGGEPVTRVLTAIVMGG